MQFYRRLLKRSSILLLALSVLMISAFSVYATSDELDDLEQQREDTLNEINSLKNSISQTQKEIAF